MTDDHLDDGQPDWFAYAACVGLDPEIFHPERGAAAGDYTPAKKICAVCPVRSECLDYAIANHERYGIWGGYGVKERDKIRRRRRAA